MNKVLNIDIAGQVFRLDELAFENLTIYLEQIRKQLREWDDAEDILKDIELRIAELLFGFSADGKAINVHQVEEIIEQVGFIDSDNELSEETTRKSFRDQENKILGGVCAGLATRFRVPVIILRLIFIALTFAFGLGVLLYLIFWISLDDNSSRNAALAALGKPRTAKQLALYDESDRPKPVASFFGSLQRIIFLPFSIIGALLSVIGAHLVRRKKNYRSVFLFAITGFLFFLTALLLFGYWALDNARLFPWLINLLIGLSIAYLLVLAWTMYVRRFYLPHSDFTIARELKLGAAAPVTFLALVFVFLFNAHYESDGQVIERDFPLTGAPITLVFAEQQSEEGYHGHPLVYFETKPPGDNQLTVTLNYSAAGRTLENATENLRGIDYSYTFADNVLALDESFTLQDGYYNREQRVNVTVAVPQFISVVSPRSFTIRQRLDEYDYRPIRRALDPGSQYIARGDYFHEMDEAFLNRLSSNEREVLEDKFCEEFFISQNWDCNRNLRTPIQNNRQFDLAFQQDMETVEQLRNLIQPNRSVFVSNLADVDSLVNSLSVDYPVMSDFQAYVNHLIEVKSI